MGSEAVDNEDLRFLRAVMRQEPYAEERFFARFYSIVAQYLAWVAHHPYSGLSDEQRRHIIDQATIHALHRLLADPSYFDPARGSPRPLLARIATNHARDLIRMEMRREQPFPPRIMPEETDAEQPPVRQPDASRPVEDVVITNENEERVHRAISELPSSQKQAIDLWLQELTTKEIAHALGKSEDAAESLIRRARASLRALLADREEKPS